MSPVPSPHLDVIPTKTYVGNSAHQLISTLAYNLVRSDKQAWERVAAARLSLRLPCRCRPRPPSGFTPTDGRRGKVDPVRQEARKAEKKDASALPGLEETAPVSDNAPFMGQEETSRHQRRMIPAALKRWIWIRDGGRCQFMAQATGQKCGSTAFLDLDHRVPVSQRGGNNEANLVLACASHSTPFWKPGDQPLYAAMLSAS